MNRMAPKYKKDAIRMEFFSVIILSGKAYKVARYASSKFCRRGCRHLSCSKWV
ncbi:hypothetical protein SBF1_2460003 [Candidatus Desulfosporosinus infrequens]|uniref:Uncharacterized protein n=1 Tax=Candidatus Desulfosporosinus infrequens TaxID=2043169 RepID=A0A2U3KNI7_9FIRM|nr:hypothetical protein SBF1_2460003 [Candidatus Desulfosporosinus infrequens]